MNLKNKITRKMNMSKVLKMLIDLVETVSTERRFHSQIPVLLSLKKKRKLKNILTVLTP